MPPLADPVRAQAVEYARSDLPGDLAWHVAYFDFISDPALRDRLGQEFYAARFLYKLWEALRIDEPWAGQAQVQLQVQQYASIYEASIHHLLFVESKDEPVVERLYQVKPLVQRDLPAQIMEMIRGLDANDSTEIVGAKRTVRRTQESKIRFDSKVDAAIELGIISEELGREIGGFYTARNYIHIHAELRHEDFEWQIAFAREAYRRLKPFKDQVVAWLANRSD